MIFIFILTFTQHSNKELILTYFLKCRSENGDAEERQGCCKCSKCCTPCLSKLCIPCRRLKNLSCCKCCKSKSESSVKNSDHIKPSFWKRMKCCGKKAAKIMSEQSLERVSTVEQMQSGVSSDPAAAKAPGKCSLCLDKFLCCRKTNKIESTSDAEDESRRCCCFPCRKSKKNSNAWVDNRRESILSEPKKQLVSNVYNCLTCNLIYS